MWIRCVKPLWQLEALRQSSKSPWLFSLFSLYSDTPHRKSKLAPLQERKMIDRFRLYAKGGDGGNGCSSLRRGRQDRRGRPDGGNGGKGGDVILECSPTVWDFSGLQHHVAADKGGQGASKNMIGTRGEDKVLFVPVGTVVHLMEGEIPSVVEKHYSTELDPWEIPGALVDNISEPDQGSSCSDPKMAAEVGTVPTTGCSSARTEGNAEISTGMKQNTLAASTDTLSQLSSSYNKSKMCTKETVKKEEMEEKERMLYNVAELTEQGQQIIVARGGQGGLGNIATGKGLKKPKSMKPGVSKDNNFDIEVSNDQASLSTGFPGSESTLVLELKSIADVSLVGMPNAGLIKGAHENRGLGHAFLRHIERTKVLAYVVDLAAGLDGRKGVPPWEQLRDLILELEYHQKGLSDRPSLIVANKIDEKGAEEVYEVLKKRVSGVPIFPVCAVLEEGIEELKTGLKGLMNGEISCRLRLDGILLD
ncbi:hypothetical protein RGQ29_000621 [Quercus rubra]|uniref:Uncharacterized protein n=2 Tax=Quercus rubra TaxID=3512 RepID=A0AAN7G508_QUERU|nr:hypothetical protein RGQ29_000621 [Quercus rubra]